MQKRWQGIWKQGIILNLNDGVVSFQEKKAEALCTNINVDLEMDNEPEDLVEVFYQEMLENLSEEQRRVESESSIAKKEMMEQFRFIWSRRIFW